MRFWVLRPQHKAWHTADNCKMSSVIITFVASCRQQRPVRRRLTLWCQEGSGGGCWQMSSSFKRKLKLFSSFFTGLLFCISWWRPLKVLLPETSSGQGLQGRANTLVQGRPFQTFQSCKGTAKSKVFLEAKLPLHDDVNSSLHGKQTGVSANYFFLRKIFICKKNSKLDSKNHVWMCSHEIVVKQ